MCIRDRARYEANLRAKGPELKIGNDYELADYLIGKIRDEKYSPCLLYTSRCV